MAINWPDYSMEFEQNNYDDDDPVRSSLELVGIVLLLAGL